jgi:hypothetical protein
MFLRLRFIWLILLAAMGPATSYGADSCQNALRNLKHDHSEEKLEGLTQVIFGGEKLKDYQYKELMDVIHQVDAMMIGFSRPSQIKLEVRPRGNRAVHANDIIMIDYQYVEECEGKIFSKHPKFTRTILAHEYGHAYFSKNMIESIPDYLALRQNAYDRYYQERFLPAVTIVGNSTDPSSIGIETLQIVISGGIRSVLKGSSAMDAAYNELIGDLVAVAYLRDPRGIYKALNFSGMTQAQRKANAYRDFTVNTRVDKNTLVGLNEHHLLAPVRYFIWRNYLSNPLFARRWSTILKGTFQAIKHELIERFSDPTLLYLNPAEINERLISQIRSEIDG